MPKQDFLSDPNGTIRRRKPKSLRRHDGLIKFGNDRTSQSGEDGILEHLFQILPLEEGQKERWCVDVGAWDGKHLSNTYTLLCEPSQNHDEWKGILIEADSEKFQQLTKLHDPLQNTCLNVTVSCLQYSSQRLSHILDTGSPEDFPRNFDFLCIDVDGTDYWLFHDILHSSFRPKVICVEFNPTMPHDLIYIQPRDDRIRNGSSLTALVELASNFDYTLVECTCYNAFFVVNDLYERHVKSEIPFEPSVEALHEVTMGTSMYQLYDGTLKISGCKKLLWHRIPIKEQDIQVLKKDEDRSFPFAPGANTSIATVAVDTSAASADDTKMFESISVDMSSYCQNTSNSNSISKEQCATSILDQFSHDGFALVRGTGIAQQTCVNALQATHMFLQEAPEAVRRSCLTKDRARRGYSPQNAENFASLIGAKGPNDLVRKYRVGPENVSGDNFALTQANKWPSNEDWGEQGAVFQSAIQKYYDEICRVAHCIVEAICDGLKDTTISSMDAFSSGSAALSHTSILTLLGYRKGARHQGKHAKPLVAAHTDVGVITVLLYDGGDSAILQRAKGDRWVDVKLPRSVPLDPYFVVNIGDCLSDISKGRLPSTIHRVMPQSGPFLSPRNCLALFVGFKSDESLVVDGECITYEEWRRRRISKAQNTLKLK